MLRTRGHKILRDVWARKGRTIMVSLAIFIGVIGTIALFSMSNILVGQLEKDIQQDKLSMLGIYVETRQGVELDNGAVLKRLSEFPGVTDIIGGESGSIVYFKAKPENKDFEQGAVQSYVVWDGNADQPGLLRAPFDAPAPLQPYRLLKEGSRNESQGRWPEPGKPELLIERRMAEEYNLKVGDTLIVRVLSPSLDPAKNGAAGTEETWTIVGLVFDPYALVPITAIYTDLANSNYLTSTVGLSFLWVRFTDFPTADAKKNEFQEVLDHETPYIPRFLQAQDPAKNSLIQNAKLLGNLMSTLALIALVVSGFLVINVISSLVVEQKRQIGVMKSIGATRVDNFFMYSGIAFAYGLIGVIPGVILGIPAGNAAAHGLAPQVNTVLEGFKVSPSSIILGVAIGLLVPVLASLLPVFNGTRVRILEAMTDLGIDARYGSGLLARGISKLPVPITVRQGLANVSIKKTRLTFTVITLAIAVGAFMGIYAIFASMKNGIQNYLDTFNVQVGIAPTQATDPAKFEAAVRDQFASDIKSLEPGFSVQVDFDGYKPVLSPFGPPGIFAYGYDVTSQDPAFRFSIDKGKPLTLETADSGVIFSSALANHMNKEVGDTVVLKVPGNSIELQIVGISEFPVDQIWISWQTLARVADFTYDTVTGGSPINQIIPEQARMFVKYASAVTVDGYASSGPLPGTLVMGITPSIGTYLQFESGSLFSPEQPGIIISQVMAEQGQYQVGDELTLTSLTAAGTSQSYPIVGVFTPPAILLALGGDSTAAASAGSALPPDFIGMAWGDAAALDGAQIETVLRPQLYFFNTPNEDPKASEMDALANRMNDVLVKQGYPIFVFNFVELTEQITKGFLTIQAILSAVAGLIALVGALGLLTTLSMSVFERQKEIGVMRSIGAGSGTVAAQFLTEGMVVGVVAWIVGLPLMLGIQWLLLQIIGPDLFGFQISLPAIIIGLIGMLIITMIASLWPSLGAARKTVSDILRYQ